MGSTYRIRNDVMTEVNRTFGGRFIGLEILKTQNVGGGRTLNTEYKLRGKQAGATTFDTELIYRDSFIFSMGEWMPKRRTVRGTHGGNAITMEVAFDSYQSKKDSAPQVR